MIVILDAQVVLTDPMFSGVAWRVLAHAGSDWGIDLRLPRVALAESVAGYGRHCDEAIAKLEKWKQQQQRLGDIDVSAVVSSLTDRKGTYAALLEQNLSKLPASVQEPPSVGHMVLVERATSRRRPCNREGDGYRDTLIWLSILEIVGDDDEAEVALVSNNTNDFGREGRSSQLHQDLIEDLDAINASTRVRWFTTIQDLVSEIAKDRADAEDLSKVSTDLVRTSVSDYVRTTLFAELSGRSLSLRRCALPRDVEGAVLSAIEAPEFVDSTITPTPGGEALAEFDVAVEAAVELRYPDSEADEAGSWADVPEFMAKPLRLQGLVVLDNLGRPVSGEVREVTALPDDPNHALWQNAASWAETVRVGARFSEQLASSPEFLGTLANVQKISEQTASSPGLRRTLAGAAFINDRLANSPGLDAAIRAARRIERELSNNPALTRTIQEVLRLQARANGQEGSLSGPSVQTGAPESAEPVSGDDDNVQDSEQPGEDGET